MTSKVFTKEEWIKSLKDLSGTYTLYGPVRDGDFHSFSVLEEGKRPDFDFRNSRLSPKSLVYPQSERIFEYILDENSPEANILKESPKEYPLKAIVGIRPCDAHAFQIVKANFDNPDYKDPWWVKRFESTVLVGLGCNEPCATCFCSSVGGGPFNERGLDALFIDMGEIYLVRAVTEKGEAFLGKASGGGPADDAVLMDAKDLEASSLEKITSSISTGKIKEKGINELFNGPFWEDVAFACLNCGACTYLCPTCWCFDIQDEVIGAEGDRIRNWDSCMFPLFTLHGSGHNPRDKKVQRVRQRFMHKLKYYPDRYDNGVQCSGCGRCVGYCPVNIDIRQVAALMNTA